MAHETHELTARAKWCRRLAGEAADAQLKSSLNDLAAELEQRARSVLKRA